MRDTSPGNGPRPGPRTGAAPAEIARFDALADRWWDPDGPMRPLHRMNPVRVAWVVARAREALGPAPPRLLDVGCGAGLAAEAFARRGWSVLGIDAAPDVIAAAAAHAPPGLDLTYGVATAADLSQRFPCLTALEVIEHVPDPAAFLRDLRALAEPGALLVLSTLDRTVASFVMAKLGAEYLLRWLPVGTHDWRRFLRPHELASLCRAAGWRPCAVTGLVYDPIRDSWRLAARPAANYMLAARAGGNPPAGSASARISCSIMMHCEQ